MSKGSAKRYIYKILDWIADLAIGIYVMVIIAIWLLFVPYIIDRSNYYKTADIRVSALHEAGHCIVAEYYFPGSVKGITIRSKPDIAEYWYYRYGDLVLEARKFEYTKIKGEASYPTSLNESVKQPSGYTNIDMDYTNENEYIKHAEIAGAGEKAVQIYGDTLDDRLSYKVGTSSDNDRKDKYIKDMLVEEGITDSNDISIEELDKESPILMRYNEIEKTIETDDYNIIAEHRSELEAITNALMCSEDCKLTSEEISSVLSSIKKKEEVIE